MPDIERMGGYPNFCLDLALGQQAVTVCAECPVADPQRNCTPYLAAQKLVEQAATIDGQSDNIAQLETRNETLTQDNLRLLERILGLRIDSLVTGMFTPEGLKDEILHHDPELAESLMGENWAVIQADVRFLNFFNGVFGQSPGDSFLQHIGNKISSIAHGLVRQGPRRTQDIDVGLQRRRQSDRRRVAEEPSAAGHTRRGDILCRRGGDEFSVVVLNIEPSDLPRLANRWQRQLGVAAALTRAPSGIPFIASIGAAHVKDVAPEMLAGKDAYGRFRTVDDMTSVSGIEAKKHQYQTMWRRLVRDSEKNPGRYLADLPQPDDRSVAELFIRNYFPDFIRNYFEILGHRQD